MKRLLHYFTLISSALFISVISHAQSVGINGTGAAPNASAMLDVSSTTSGMLVPRMTQTQRNAIATPATGLLIYQVDAIAGFYYFDGTIWKWMGGSNGWLLTGNSGTVPGTNFIGTIDANDLVFKTNGSENMRLANTTGNLILGSGDGTGAVNGNILRAPNAAGLNITGADMAIMSGNGTGTGGSGNLIFESAPAGATGSTVNTMTQRMLINQSGNVIIGSGEGTNTVIGNTLRAPSALGINIAGADLTVTPGNGTGTGGSGNLIFESASAGITGGTVNTMTERMRLTLTGALAFGGAANYGSSGQVLVSNGNSAPMWASIIPGTPFVAGTGLSLAGNILNSYWTLSGNNLYNNNSGNIGIGTASPLSMFSVGSASQFQVNASGDINSIKGVGYSWPTANPGLGIVGVLENDGSGNLTWTTANSALTTNNIAAVIGSSIIVTNGTGQVVGGSNVSVDVQGTNGGVFYGTGAGTSAAFTPAGTSGQVLVSSGAAAPTWLTLSAGEGINITTVADSLIISDSNIVSGPAGSILYGTGTSYGSSAVGDTGQVLISGGAGAPTWGTAFSGTGFIVGTGLSMASSTLNSYWTFDNSTNNLYNNNSGNIGIGTTSPSSLLSVGPASQFQVNPSGDITSIKGVTYSWPSSNPGVGNTSIMQNDGSGNLSWVSLGSALGTSSVMTTTPGVIISNGAGQVVGGSNLSVDVATNSVSSPGLVTAGSGNNNKVWGTDGSGNPSWTTANSALTTNNVTSSTSGITIGNGTGQVVGGSNLTIDVATNSSSSPGLVTAGSGSNNKLWGTDGSGNPSWTVVDLSKSVTNILPVGNGGTGLATLTTNGIIYGNGTGAVGITSAGSQGQLVTVNASGVPLFTTATYPATTTADQLLFSSANNTVTGLAAGTNGQVLTMVGGIPTWSAPATQTFANLTPGTGLSGSVYNGSTAQTFAVNYGSAAGTSVQGNTTLTISPGTGMSGGGTITLGSGGTVTLNNTGVTSVGLALPSIFTVTNSPVTTTGILTGSFTTELANTVFAGPTSGIGATPTFRALVAADIPAGVVTANNGLSISGGNNVQLGGTLIQTTTITQGNFDLISNMSGTGNFRVQKSAADALEVMSATGNVVIGSGEATAVVAGNTLRAPNATGTNIAGANLTITSGDGTGTGGSGNVIFQSAPTAATGTTANTMTERMRLTTTGALAFSGAANYGTSGSMLQSTGNSTPAWSTATYPTTTTANQLLYSSATNTVTGLAAGTNGQVLSIVGGVPTWASASASLANLTPGTGLSGSVYNGSTAQTFAVNYGSAAGTSVQGNTTLTISPGTGMSGGGTITLGTGGTVTLNNTGVTSVGLALPSIFTVTNSPVTTTGTLTGSFTTETANTVFAGPSSGVAATPTFRALVAADIPAGVVTANNGLNISGGNNVQLGGTLIQTTTITQGNFDLISNMSGTGNFRVQKSAADALEVMSATGNVVIGSGEATAVVAGNTLRAPNATGTNIAGANLTITSGDGTGTGGSGNVIFQSAPTAATGATANTMTERMRLTTTGALAFSGAANYGTSGSMLQSTGNSTPAWSTATYPTTTTANQLLYSSATNTVTGLAAGTNGQVLTMVGGVPTWGAATGNYWSINGNGGTVPGTNFLGTTDANDLVFETNSSENMRIANSSGNVVIGNGEGGSAVGNTIRAPYNNSGGNRTGADLTIAAGAPTGKGASGSIIFQTLAANVGSPGNLSDLSIMAEVMRITSTGALAFSGAANYGTSGSMLQSTGNSTPAWSTATYPTTTTANQLLYSSATNTVTGLAAGTNGQVLSIVGGVPTWASASASLANLTPGTGLSGSVYNGSTAQTFAVNYGSAAGTSVQGNTTLTISPGTGMSGGGTITLGSGGTVTLNNTGVTSVGLALPSIFTVTNSPVTTTGTLTGSFTTETANTVFAGPSSGVAATPTFRALVAADIPAGVVTANNGLSISGGNNVQLGGTLIQTTTITQGNFDLISNMSGTGNFRVQKSAADALEVMSATGNVVIGSGEATAVVAGNTLRAPNATGTNIAGANLTITSGDGTGTGGSGNVIFQTAPTAATGATANTMTERMRLTTTGALAFSGAANYGTSGSMLQSTGNSTPAWSTATYPTTTTANQLLYSSATNTVTGLAAGTNGQVLSIVGGVPTWASASASLANLTPGTGLSGSVYNGSTAQTFAVNYGSAAGTSVQGNTTLTISPGTGMSGGGTITLGTGGTVTLNNTGVTSVGLALPSIFTVTNSPVTTTGTLTGSFTTETANTVFAGPSSGVAATPTFRALVAADIPAGVVTANNGLNISGGNNVQLGGTLIQTTTITQGNFDLISNMSGTGNFRVQKSAADALEVMSATGNVVIGSGEATAVVAGNTLRAPNATGTNIAGANLTITSGDGTGTGGSGNVIFQSAPTAATGATANTMTERMRLTTTGALAFSGAANYGTSGSMLQSTGNSTPAWSTATYPTTTTANQLLYSSATNTVTGLAAGTNGQVLTMVGGVPTWGAATGNYWSINGNSGTTAGTNFIGTTDATDFEIKTGVGPTERMHFVNTTGNVVIGSGEGTGAVTGNTLRAPNATGTNIAGVDFTIAGGNGTGTGGGGDVVFQTSPIGASGTTANTLTERMRINYAGNVIIGTGDGTGTVTGNTLRGPNPIGTNIAGVDFTIAGGGGTGTGGGGDVVFQTAPAAATGATANTLTERMRIMYTGNVGIGTAAPSTLLQVNGTASLGTPSSNTGTLQFDNNTNANTVSISAGATSTSYSLTLPTAAPASNGQVLSSTTAGVMSWSSPSGQLKGIICDTTAGATVATLAAGTTMIVVKVVGGGGAGGGIGLSGTIYEDQTGSGGGAGAYCEGYLSGITVGTSTVTMTVGAGATGAGGNNGTVATSGGSSTVVVTSPAATFTAGGGKGGTTAEENTGGSSINQAGGSGGTASGGSINIPGSNGGSAIISITGNDVVFAGEGASSIFGNGGQQQYTRDDIAYTGLTAHAPGAGGGGAVAVQQSSNTNTKGGSGEHGIIIIYEY